MEVASRVLAEQLAEQEADNRCLVLYPYQWCSGGEEGIKKKTAEWLARMEADETVGVVLGGEARRGLGGKRTTISQ